MSFEDAANQTPREPESEPRPINTLLGRPSSATELGKIRYPVEMSRESLDGQVLDGPHKLANRAELKTFCDEKESEETELHNQLDKAWRGNVPEQIEKAQEAVKGYWRIRSVE